MIGGCASWISVAKGKVSAEIVRIAPDSWERLRDLRLEALRESPEAFSNTFAQESLWTESVWRQSVGDVAYLVVSRDDQDLALVSIENLDGDYGATCWISGCWIRPDERGRGLLNVILEYIDEHSLEENWSVQGIGVLTHNTNAIAAYEHLGFKRKGSIRSDRLHPDAAYQRMLRLTPGFEFDWSTRVAIWRKRLRFVIPEILRRIRSR